MDISTAWNVGDTVWAVVERHGTEDRPCPACNGKGGATIPGTQVRVACQECNGDCTVEFDTTSYDVTPGLVSSIDIDVRCWRTDRGVEVRQSYSGYYREAVHPEQFAAVFATKAEADAWVATRTTDAASIVETSPAEVSR
jgi:hypothetical protein